MHDQRSTGARARVPAASGLFVLLAAAPVAATASTVTLNGSGSMGYSFQYVAPNAVSPTLGNDYGLDVPGTYTFNDTLAPETAVLGASGVGSYGFQDSYRFTVGSVASGDTLVASLSLPSPGGGTAVYNIDHLQFRLYEVASGTTVPIIGGTPAGSTLVTAWMGPASGQTAVSATFTGLQAGTYILDVAGLANGSSGGTYVGQLQLAPVPLPAALPLALSGLGCLGIVGRRRRRRA